MRPPGFWSNPSGRPGWPARLLAPLGALYAAATAARVARPGWRAPVPVICVGNVSLGGTGKTPAVIALAGRLAARGVRVAVVSRGYGGTLAGPVRVDERRHSAAEVGDEPLLLSAFAPVFVARDRAAGVRAAVAEGAGVVLLDDGLQNPSVIRDAAVVTVDAAVGFGNGKVFPAGPLREPVAAAMARTDLVLAIGPAEARERFARDWPLPVPVVGAELRVLETGMDWAGLPVLAFAGIGRPGKMFDSLRALGADLRGTVALDDHQPLTAPLLRRIEAQALAAGAQMVTTEKDAVRLPAAWRAKVLVLPVRLEPLDWAPLDALFSRLGL